VTFTPLASFTGSPPALAYQVQDSLGQYGSSSYTPTVTPPTGPAATAETKTVLPGASVGFTNVIGASGLGSGTGLKSGASGGPCLVDPSDSVCKTSFSIAGEGSWSIDQTTGVATFTAVSSAVAGNLTAVTYRITDGVGQTATSTLTPQVPAAPVAKDDSSSGKYDTNQTLTPLGNDSSDVATPLDKTTLKLCGAGQTPPGCGTTSVTIAGEGTYTLNADGTVAFDPVPGFFGSATPVRYQVSDSVGRVSDAFLKPVVDEPAKPVAKDDTSSGLWDANQLMSPVSNDTADAATPLDKTTLKLCGAGQTPPGCGKTSVTIAGEGTYTLNADGTVTFDPLPTFSGAATPQRYQVADSIGRLTDAVLKPSVAPPPVARADSSQGEMGERQVVSLTGNDDPGAVSAPLDPASIRLCGAGEAVPACTKTQVTVAGEGTYSVNGNGTVDFVPEAKFVGTATAVPYVVSDVLGQKVASTVTVTVVPPPAPIAEPDLVAGRSGQVLVFSPWLNDSGGEIPAGVDGTVDVVRTSIRLCGDTERVPNCTQTTLTTSDGTYTLDPKTGKVTFVHAPGFSGAATSPPTYQIANDWKGASGSKVASSVLIPTILPSGPGAPPVALPDSSQGRKGKPQTVPILGNDAAASSPFDTTSVKMCATGEVAPKCTATTLTVPGEGTYVVGKDGSVVFTPEPAFLGTATPQRYVVADKAGKATSSTVTVRVLDQPIPAAVADTGRAKQGSTVELAPWLNDDAGGDGTSLVPTSIRLCGPGESVPNCTKLRLATADGVYTVDPKSGKVTFVHKAGFTGEVSEPVNYQIANDYAGKEGPGYAVGVLKPTIFTSDAKVVDQVNWTTPSTPVWLNPTSGGKPSKGSSFKLGTVRIKIGGDTFEVVNTSEGKWEVIRGLVRFTPKSGFVGRTKAVAFVVTDTDGATVGATLRVTVDPDFGKAGFLPATGRGVGVVWLGLVFVALGLVVRRRRFSQPA
jgi:CshA-type fibril repeat protein